MHKASSIAGQICVLVGGPFGANFEPSSRPADRLRGSENSRSLSLGGRDIPPWTDRLLREALAIEAEEAQRAGALSFMARLLVQTTLPHSRHSSKTFVRTNGVLKVAVSAHPLLELPYGRYPRLLMAWVTTEAVRTREPVLQLGPSLSSFMSQIGLLPRGGQTGPIGRLRDQMQRLFGATIASTWDKRTAGEWHDSGFRVSNEAHLWWNPVRPEQAVSWRSTVTLRPGFFDAVCDRPVPIDLRVLEALRSPMAIDLYCWLTYRNSYLKKPSRIPWAALAAQFGASYRDHKDFKRYFLAGLRQVLVLPSRRGDGARHDHRPEPPIADPTRLPPRRSKCYP